MARLGFINRGIKNGSNLYVIRRTNARAMLIEVCFVDTRSDADLYRRVGTDAIANAIANAIIGNSEEELTMAQYDELKGMLETQTARIDVLQNEVYKINNPMIYNYIDENMPEWAREAVQWCVDTGIIVGTGDGLGLDDTKLWVCVVIYRLAQQLG